MTPTPVPTSIRYSRQNRVDSWGETEHRYGPEVHLCADSFLAGILARLGSPDAKAPEVQELVRSAYRRLMARVAAAELPVSAWKQDTRMKATTPQGVWKGNAVDPKTRVVIANILRGGNIPSLTCFDELSQVLDSDNIRIDHLYLARRTDENGHVVGVDASGSKIGGGLDGAVLLIPDPMGATGSTILEALEVYRQQGRGKPSAVVAMHLMITPEYVRKVTGSAENVVVYAGRLDRGLSSPDVLETVPGERIEEEKGLDENSYIVPGAGGVGEVLNNSWC